VLAAHVDRQLVRRLRREARSPLRLCEWRLPLILAVADLVHSRALLLRLRSTHRQLFDLITHGLAARRRTAGLLHIACRRAGARAGGGAVCISWGTVERGGWRGLPVHDVYVAP